jgi:hypothetical protein
MEIQRLRKERKRRVQGAPREERRNRIKGEKSRPPIPAPDRMRPMAVPRWRWKYSGALLRIGKYRQEEPSP